MVLQRWHFVSALPLVLACDLSSWLNEEKNTDKGYHVLCVKGKAIEINRNGVLNGQKLEATVDDAVADSLENILKISRFLQFTPDAPDANLPWPKNIIRWPKQSWAVFTAKGERWEPEMLSKQLESFEGPLLLFEGGVWRWPGVRIGYDRPLLPGVSLRTVSMKPALFELVFGGEEEQIGADRNLSPDLLRDVIEMARPDLDRSLTEGEATKIRTSENSWLSYSLNDDLKRLKDLTIEALHIPGSYFESSFQVLRYKKGQLYDAHRDYWDPAEFPDEKRFVSRQSGTWKNRHATVLWFLKAPKAGGETWFPRAHGGPIPVGEWTACDDRGVKMSGRNGTIAVLFYNLYSSGDIDTFSWHCGCPVEKGVKWAANSWVWNQQWSGSATVKRRPKKKKKKEDL